MRPWTVGIVGGGPGGLFTAHSLMQLARRPIRISLFEGSTRLGGKLLTRRFEAIPARYEAGAAEFYDYSAVDEDPLKSIVTSLGLSTVPLSGSAVVMDGVVLGCVEDWETRLGVDATGSILEFDRRSKASESPGEYYDSGTLGWAEVHATDSAVDVSGDRFVTEIARVRHPVARRYLEVLLKSDLATEPTATSLRYGRQNYLMNDPAYMDLYAIAGGNEQLVTRLTDVIDVDRHIGRRVTAVGRSDAGRIAVTVLDAAGHADAIGFDVVVLALPMNHLRQLTWTSPRLEVAMRRHIAGHDHPGHYLRITAAFDRPFWRRTVRDSFFMLDRFGGCCLYDESAREPGLHQGVLGCLLGGDAARRMASLGDDEIVGAVLGSLPQSLGIGRLLEAHVHRWTDAVSGLPGGCRPLPLDQRHRPEPIEHDRLFLVGDYLFDSTLNGVLDSASYVAGWIAALLDMGPFHR